VTDDQDEQIHTTPAGPNPRVESRVVVHPGATVPHHPARVLVTNDDGVDSPGIHRLAAALATEFTVTVAAPSEDWSGAGTSIGRFDAETGIPMRRVQLDGQLEGQLAYAIDGPPGLAVLAAALGAFGDPFDVVVSGINAGINTGNSVIHSGTVGAALTARTFGAHGVAVSLVPSDPWHWDTAAELGLAAARWVTSQDRPPTTVSLNVPSRPIGEIRGLRRAELTDFGYFRVAIANEGEQKLEFEVMSAYDTAPEGSDTWLLGEGFATISVLGELTAASAALPAELDEIWKP
jgi:5'-nucleotidase